MNPFDHIKNLHTKKRRWEDFNDEEKKSFNVFIINKGLSMNPNYLGIVNMVQNFTDLIFILIYFLIILDFINGLREKKQKKTKKKRNIWLCILKLVLERHTIIYNY